MILRVHQFLIVSRSKRSFFRYHMVNVNNHYSCKGNDCFFVTTTFFHSTILDCKVRLLLTFNCGKGTCLLKKSANTGQEVLYTYDPMGNLTAYFPTKQGTDGTAWMYRYDFFDRLIEARDPLGNS